LFLSRAIGKIKLYRLNRAYPLYNEIKGIIRKTVGIEAGVKAALSGVKGIDFAFIYGSFAEDRETSLSDIDIIIIAGARPKEIKSRLFEYQSRIAREINSIIYTKKEFLSKLAAKDHFVTVLLGKKKIFIQGDANEFGRFIQIRQARKT
jgi:predicted nucleotidyltransferase